MMGALVLGFVILVISGCAWTARRYRRAQHAALLVRLERAGARASYSAHPVVVGDDDTRLRAA